MFSPSKKSMERLGVGAVEAADAAKKQIADVPKKTVYSDEDIGHHVDFFVRESKKWDPTFGSGHAGVTPPKKKTSSVARHAYSDAAEHAYASEYYAQHHAGASSEKAEAAANTAAKKVLPTWGGYPMKKKTSSAKEGSVLAAIMPTANEADLDSFRRTITDYDVRLAYEKNAAATIEALQTILADRPDKAKFASVMSSVLRPTVAQIVRIDDGYSVKTASHLLWNPQMRYLSRGEAMQEFGSKIVLAADMSGATTIADGADAAEPAVSSAEVEKLAPVDVSGMYKVRSLDGVEMVGCVIHGLLDVDGSTLPLSLFTNGSVAALQEDILGEAVSGDPHLPTSDMPSGYGMFHATTADGLVGTIPMDIHSSWSEQGSSKKYQAVTFDGRQIQVTVQPNIITVVSSDPQTMLIPQGWKWTPLGPSHEAALVSSEDTKVKTSSAQRHLASVSVVSSGNTFSFRGHAVEKLAHVEREFLDLDAAMFLMAGLGVEQQYGLRKLGESFNGREPAQVRIGRFITTADEQVKEAQAKAAHAYSLFPSLKRQLFKEAAVVTDPEAVDAVLSIGFINPENLTAFISYMPTLESASEKLAEILMAARLGLSSIPMGAIEKSMRALEEVLEGLKALAFEEPQTY